MTTRYGHEHYDPDEKAWIPQGIFDTLPEALTNLFGGLNRIITMPGNVVVFEEDIAAKPDDPLPVHAEYSLSIFNLDKARWIQHTRDNLTQCIILMFGLQIPGQFIIQDATGETVLHAQIHQNLHLSLQYMNHEDDLYGHDGLLDHKYILEERPDGTGPWHKIHEAKSQANVYEFAKHCSGQWRYRHWCPNHIWHNQIANGGDNRPDAPRIHRYARHLYANYRHNPDDQPEAAADAE